MRYVTADWLLQDLHRRLDLAIGSEPIPRPEDYFAQTEPTDVYDSTPVMAKSPVQSHPRGGISEPTIHP